MSTAKVSQAVPNISAMKMWISCPWASGTSIELG
jgi:hypothetical protein